MHAVRQMIYRMLSVEFEVIVKPSRSNSHKQYVILEHSLAEVLKPLSLSDNVFEF